ncbi:hypothetical protein D931_02830 [Enterococcus faecium 13.SD.W.09]|nr:hypothetical protein D931_02830 [Enterococcus faecium 13.SD.W.09]
MDEKRKAALEVLVQQLGINESMATVLIEDAENLVLDYTYRDSMEDGMWVYARQLATIAFNQQGAEGEASRSEGGVSRSFITDIPLQIQRGLNRFRVGKVVSYYASNGK